MHLVQKTICSIILLGTKNLREKNCLIVLEEVCKIPKWKNEKGECINHDDDEDEYCNDKQLFFHFYCSNDNVLAEMVSCKNV